MEAIRSCIGCGARAPRSELLRIVGRTGTVVIDTTASLPGRGAWLHHRSACIERAIARGAFSRALRMSGTPDITQLENRLETMMDNS